MKKKDNLSTNGDEITVWPHGMEGVERTTTLKFS